MPSLAQLLLVETLELVFQAGDVVGLKVAGADLTFWELQSADLQVFENREPLDVRAWQELLVVREPSGSSAAPATYFGMVAVPAAYFPVARATQAFAKTNDTTYAGTPEEDLGTLFCA